MHEDGVIPADGQVVYASVGRLFAKDRYSLLTCDTCDGFRAYCPWSPWMAAAPSVTSLCCVDSSKCARRWALPNQSSRLFVSHCLYDVYPRMSGWSGTFRRKRSSCDLKDFTSQFVISRICCGRLLKMRGPLIAKDGGRCIYFWYNILSSPLLVPFCCEGHFTRCNVRNMALQYLPGIYGSVAFSSSMKGVESQN